MPSTHTIQLGDGNRAVAGGLAFLVRRSSDNASISFAAYWVVAIHGHRIDVDPHLGELDLDDHAARTPDWRRAADFISDPMAYMQEYLSTLVPRTGRAQREANRRLETITDRTHPKEPQPRRAAQ